jgi:hypothetical protein
LSLADVSLSLSAEHLAERGGQGPRDGRLGAEAGRCQPEVKAAAAWQFSPRFSVDNFSVGND